MPYGFQTNTVRFGLNGQPAAACRLPRATASHRHWNLGEIGSIHLPEAAPQLLTFHHGEGDKFAWFEFEPISAPTPAGR
jgi:hypothetical protein